MGYRAADYPFWGESMSVEAGSNLTGAALSAPAFYGAGQIRTREPLPVGVGVARDGAMFTAGDSVCLSVPGYGSAYLMPGDVAVCSWVVEVYGGSGTLRLTDAVVPAGTATDAGIPSGGTDRGAQTVTGATTLVWPAAVTVADLIAATSDPMCVLACESGDVHVQQVKLRVWPPGGPIGSLSAESYPTPSQRSEVVAGRYITQVGGGATGFGDPASAWEAGWAARTGPADYTAGQTEPVAPGSGYFLLESGMRNNSSVTGEASAGWLGQTNGDGEGAYGGGGYTTAVHYYFDGRQASSSWYIDPALGSERVDFITHPNEVPGDPRSRAYKTQGPIVQFEPMTVTLTANHVLGGSTTWTAARVDGVPEFVNAGQSVRYPAEIGSLGGWTASGGGGADVVVSTYVFTPPEGVEVFTIRGASSVQGAPAPPYPGPGQWGELSILTLATTNNSTNNRVYVQVTNPPYRLWRIPPPGPVDPPEDEVVPAGYFVDHASNLDGLNGGVDVTFA